MISRKLHCGMCDLLYERIRMAINHVAKAGAGLYIAVKFNACYSPRRAPIKACVSHPCVLCFSFKACYLSILELRISCVRDDSVVLQMRRVNGGCSEAKTPIDCGLKHWRQRRITDLHSVEEICAQCCNCDSIRS